MRRMRRELRAKLAWCLAQEGAFSQGDFQRECEVHQTAAGKLFWRLQRLGLLQMTPVSGRRDLKQLWQVCDRPRAELLLQGPPLPRYQSSRPAIRPLINSVWSLAACKKR